MKKTVKSRRPVRSSAAVKTSAARRAPKKATSRKIPAKKSSLQQTSSTKRAGAQRHLVVLGAGDPLLTTFSAIRERMEPPVEFVCQPELKAALEEDGTVIIPIRSPIEVLAGDLSAGATPSEALDRWTKATDALLKTCRGKRRRILVLDAGALLQGAPDSLEALTTRLKVTCEISLPERREDLPPPINWTLAAGALAADAAACGLADTLEALITGPIAPRWPDSVTISNAWTDVKAKQREKDEACATLAQENAELLGAEHAKLHDGAALAREGLALNSTELDQMRVRAERAEAANKQLLEHLALTREGLSLNVTELDGLRTEVSTQTASYNELRDMLSARDAELSQNKTALADDAKKLAQITEEADLLRENLALMMTELEQKSQAIASLETDRAKLRDTLADFHLQRAEIVALNARLAGAEKVRQRREAVLSAMLLQAKATVQEQEAVLRDRQEAMAALSTQSGELVERIAALETDKKAHEAYKQKLETNAEGLRAEIEKVYTSKSWRITEPLRRARSILPVDGRS